MGPGLLPAAWPTTARYCVQAVSANLDLAEVTLIPVNTSDQAVTPHFAFRAEGGTSNWWQVLQGPSTLQPGGRASYTIELKGERQSLVGQSTIIAVSDRPMTISSVRLPSALARG